MTPANPRLQEVIRSLVAMTPQANRAAMTPNPRLQEVARHFVAMIPPDKRAAMLAEWERTKPLAHSNTKKKETK